MSRGRKKLPIGIQSFEEIRTENYYYVDKTPFVARLVDEGKYYFLSRPRRFGKSLFLDTLKQAFLGRRELFEGLYLEKNWDWGKSYPVVHIDFAGGIIRNVEDLERWIVEQLELNEKNLGVKCEKREYYRSYFNELILKANSAHMEKVVVLIDEYDKPILDRIEEVEEAKRIREVLKNFYSVLKPLDVYLKFVFITGVSKFSKVSLFSGLNQLNDISLDRAWGAICGYTQSELETVFKEELEGEDLLEIKCWYDGYSFCGESVYNPFDILLYLQKREFRPYWFETGTPTFLIKIMVDRGFYIPQLEHLVATERLIGSFDVDFIEPENLLFQTGYLTIKDYKRSLKGITYYLGYPNKEVKISLNEYIAAYLTQLPAKVERLGDDLGKEFSAGNIDRIGEVLNSLFSSIPYEWYRKNEISRYEGYYASVVYSFLAGAGFELIAEDYTNKGRIDLTIIHGGKAYIFEFKVVEQEGEFPRAIEVLRSKGYHEKYLNRAEEVYVIGIDFSSRNRNILSFEWERLC